MSGSRALLVLFGLFLIAGAFANVEEEEEPSNYEEESTDDVITVEDLDRQLLPKLRWRGMSYYAKTGRFLARKLRQLHKRMGNENWRALRHMVNSRNLCTASKAKECPETSCQNSAACRIRSFDRRQRALHKLYSETYAAYLKVAGRYNQGEFRALAREYLRFAKKHARLQRAYNKLRRKVNHTKKRNVEAQKKFKDLQNKVNGCRQKLAALNDQIRDWKVKAGNMQNRLKLAEGERDAHKNNADKAEQNVANIRKVAAAHNAQAAKLENEAANFCPFKDVCGVCKGDGKVCAKLQAPRQCHSVGDPHFRSFDGFTFDYMTDGDMTLAKYPDVGPNRFEVQARQIGDCAPGHRARCNKGFAVMANGHVLVSYGAWFSQRGKADLISINGNQQVLPVGQWVHFADHALRVRLNSAGAPANMEIFYCWNNQVCDTKITVNFNTYGPHLDIYVQARAQMSTGHMTGLCGNYDGDINNDRAAIFNNVAQYRQTGANSLFESPGKRMLDLEEDPEEDNGNDDGIRAPAKELPIPNEKMDFGKDNGPADVEDKPRHTIDLKAKLRVQANAERVQQACGKLQGTEKNNCAFDVLAGVPEDDVKHLFAESNIMDHERQLTKCKRLVRAGSFQFVHPRLPAPIPDEGYTLSMWFKPQKDCEKECSVMDKGDMMKVTQTGRTVSFAAGTAKCSAPAQALGDWKQYTAAVGSDGSLQVFQNGNKVCDAPGGGSAPSTADNIVNAKEGTEVAVGKIASVYWAPVTVAEAENKIIFANRGRPRNC